MKIQFSSVTPRVTVADQKWSDWHWQLSNSLKNQNDFSTYFQLSQQESEAFNTQNLFSFQTTPYYASLASPSNNLDPIRMMQMPHKQELESSSEDSSEDPLGESKNRPQPRLIHRYNDRVLLLVTDFCGTFCRYCTRKHYVGAKHSSIGEKELDLAINYILDHKGIREVILSGGDPLTLSDDNLEQILCKIRRIDHVEVIRIGSKMPTVCPMRLTKSLAQIIRKYAPAFLMTHFNHPRELTLEVAKSLEIFIDSGIPVFNQMVLLNGINNHPTIIQALSRRLLFLRVKPHYAFQCDPSMGTAHLRTSIDQSLEIQNKLWGHLSGLALPSFSLDIPEGGGKIPLTPHFQISQESNSRSYRGFDGISGQYINPPKETLRNPYDWEDYAQEWQELLNAKTSEPLSSGLSPKKTNLL